MSGRWPRKREIAALWLLHERGPKLNLGAAVDILRAEFCVTKRTAVNIVKRLKRIGAVRIMRGDGEFIVEAVDPASFIAERASSYIASRRARCKGGG